MRLWKPLSKRRHLLRKIVDRASLGKHRRIASELLPLRVDDSLDLSDRVTRSPQRLEPLFVDRLVEQFVHNRIAQRVLPLEMMEDRPLGSTSLIHDPVETSPLETMPVKLLESSFQDLRSRSFR